MNVYDGYQNQVFCYNFKAAAEVQLSEDRKVKQSYIVNEEIRKFIRLSEDESFLEAVLLADRNTFEGNFEYNENDEASDEFMDVCERNRKHSKINQSAWRLTKNNRKVGEEYTQVAPTKAQAVELKEAIKSLKMIDVTITRKEISVVEDLGYHDYLLRDDKIVIAQKRLDEGVLRIARILYQAKVKKDDNIGSYGGQILEVVLEQTFDMATKLKTARK